MKPTIADLYNFKVYLPLEGWVDMLPVNSSLEWEDQLQDGQKFYRRKLKTKLKFKGEDFTKLYQVDRSGDRCTKLDLQVFRKCPGDEIATLFWEGYIACVDAEWDPDFCTMEVLPRPGGPLQCVLESWQEQRDVIGKETGDGVPLATEIKIIQGQIQYLRYPFHGEVAYTKDYLRDFYTKYFFINPADMANVVWKNGNPNTLPCFSGWLFAYNTPHDRYGFGFVGIRYHTEAVYVREVLSGIESEPPEGNGWEWCAAESMWTRTPEYLLDYMRGRFKASTGLFANLKQGEEDAGFPPGPIGEDGIWYPTPDKFEDFKYRENYRLGDVIQWFLEPCGLGLASDYLSYNAPGEALDNDAYNIALIYYSNLRLIEKSNAKRPDASQLATRELLAFKELMDDLAQMEVYSCIDPQGRFRVEHVSWFEANNRMIDLTAPALFQMIVGKAQYTYDISGLPKAEVFKWPEESDSNFDFGTIKYSGACLDLENATEQEIRVNKLMTNIGWLLGDPEGSSDSGFALVACTDDDAIWLTHTYDQGIRFNAILSWDSLLTWSLRHDRPLPIGTIRNTPIPFFSSKRLRKQRELSFRACCSNIQDFNPAHLIKTQLGWGAVQSATLKDPEHLITVNLAHS